MEVLVEDLVQWRCSRTCTTGLAMFGYVVFELMATSPSYFAAGSFMH